LQADNSKKMDSDNNSMVPEGIAGLASYVDSIPLPPAIKKSLWKAVGDLITGAVDVPVAFLEAKAQQIRTEAQGLAFVTKKSAEAAAQKFGGDEKLVERAVGHFGHKLFKEQMNREKIAAIAIEELKNDPPSQDSSSEIDDDWLSMFSRVAEQKSNQDVQLFLSKILAGEIRKPGSYSPQTIHVLSILTQEVAQIFQKFCDVSFSHPKSPVPFLIAEPFGVPGQNVMEPIGLAYRQLTKLQDAGLIQYDLNAWSKMPVLSFSTPFKIGSKDYHFRVSPDANISDLSTQRIKILIINFTAPGLQLRSVLHLGSNSIYEEKIMEWFRDKHSFLILP
jgi:hypothetical protein